MIIAGAGLSGLIAGVLSRATIYEKAPAPSPSHRALLRFRSDAVSRAVGIPFRPVTVRKGIFLDNRFVEPSIRIANLYSQKVIGRFEDRSIWDIEPVTRWVAPETLYEQLIDMNRVEWGHDVFEIMWNNPDERMDVVSTVPMDVTLKCLGFLLEPEVPFRRAPIHVRRCRLSGCDVHQTLYFPSPAIPMYRASITGNLLIIESTSPVTDSEVTHALIAFGMDRWPDNLDHGEQSYGKISPINESFRRGAIATLTMERGIYSLGRFATWRNILLDDIPGDFEVIRRLMHADDYTRRKMM